MYSDCWTYPKEKIDELINNAEQEAEEFTYSKEQIDKKIPFVNNKNGGVIIGDCLICYGTHKFNSVATSASSIDVSFPNGFEYLDDYAVIVTNSYYYDSYVDVVGSKNTSKKFTLWARAVNSTQSDVYISWITIGKVKGE